MEIVEEVAVSTMDKAAAGTAAAKKEATVSTADKVAAETAAAVDKTAASTAATRERL